MPKPNALTDELAAAITNQIPMLGGDMGNQVSLQFVGDISAEPDFNPGLTTAPVSVYRMDDRWLIAVMAGAPPKSGATSPGNHSDADRYHICATVNDIKTGRCLSTVFLTIPVKGSRVATGQEAKMLGLGQAVARIMANRSHYEAVAAAAGQRGI